MLYQETRRLDWVKRRLGALPLTPQTQELSSVKDHRYGRQRRVEGEREKEHSNSNSYDGEFVKGVKPQREAKKNRRWRKLGS